MNKIRKIVFYLLILSIPFSFQSWSQIRIPSLNIENLSITVLVGLIISYLVFLTIFLYNKPSLRLKNFLIPTGFLFAGYSIGVLVANAEITSIRLFLNMVLFLGVSIAICSLVKSVKDLRNGIGLLLLAVVILAARQLYSLFSGDITRVNIARGMYGRNATALIILSLFPFSFSGFSLSQTRQKRFIYFACAVILMIGLLLTYSRGGVLAVALGLVTSVLLLRKSPIGRKYSKYVFLFILLMTIPLTVLMRLPLKEKLLSISDISEKKYQSSNVDRIILARSGLRMIAANPILGIGVGKFDEKHQNYSSSEEKSVLSRPKYYSSHNQYIHAWNEGGILGFIGFIALLFLLLKTFKSYSKTFRMDKDFQVLIIGCLTLWITYGWYFLFAWPLQRTMFWVALGISLATIKLYKINKREDGINNSASQNINKK